MSAVRAAALVRGTTQVCRRNEAAMVLGFSVKYDVVDLVGTQASVAAEVPTAAALAKMAKKPAS